MSRRFGVIATVLASALVTLMSLSAIAAPFSWSTNATCTFDAGKSVGAGHFGPSAGGYNTFEIRYVSGSGTLPTGQALYLQFSDNESWMTLTPHKVFTSGSLDQFTLSEPVYAYITLTRDTIYFNCVRSDRNGTGSFTLYLNGIVNGS